MPDSFLRVPVPAQLQGVGVAPLRTQIELEAGYLQQDGLLDAAEEQQARVVHRLARVLGDRAAAAAPGLCEDGLCVGRSKQFLLPNNPDPGIWLSESIPLEFPVEWGAVRRKKKR